MCPFVADQATSVSPTKIGLNAATSLFWLPSEKTSLWKKTSPGYTSPANFSAMCAQTGLNEKLRIGRFSVCSSMRPCASYSPVTKSFASQRIGERVVFSMLMLISSVNAFNARPMIETSTLSISTPLITLPP